MNNYSIIITQRAYSSIIDCVAFVNNISNEAANQLYDEIISSLNSLSTFPNKYPEIQNLLIRDSKVRKMPIHNGRYVALYKVDVNSVCIYDVIDTRKDNILLKI